MVAVCATDALQTQWDNLPFSSFSPPAAWEAPLICHPALLTALHTASEATPHTGTPHTQSQPI